MNPTFVEGGQRKLFDACLACGPFEVKRSQLPHHDVFKRFSAKSFYGEIADAQHALAQTGSRAIVVVPNGVLFRSAAAERDFKEEVVRRGWLNAVITLPEGLLSNTSLRINQLVFDKTSAYSDVLFIDASKFAEPRRERRISRNRLTNIAGIVDLFRTRKHSDVSRAVLREDCEKQEYDLMVERYALNFEQKETETALSQHATVRLDEVAEII